jgi:hypothetical protein
MNSLSIDRNGARVTISGPCTITPDAGGLAALRDIDERLKALAAAAPAFPIRFEPFSKPGQVLQIGELDIENADDGLSFIGSHTMIAGSTNLSTFVAAIEAAIAAIESGAALPPAAVVETTTLVDNPFA